MRGRLSDVNRQLRDMQYISGENVNVKLAGSDAIEYHFFDYGYGGAYVSYVCMYVFVHGVCTRSVCSTQLSITFFIMDMEVHMFRVYICMYLCMVCVHGVCVRRN
jgi:hypothetical protein